MTLTATILKQDLKQFCGTDRYYYDPLFKNINYTDGFRYFMHNAGEGAHWFLILVATEIRPILEEDFYFIELLVNADETAKIMAEIGVCDEEINLRNKTRFMVSFSAVVRKVIDQMPYGKAVKYIDGKIKDNDIDLTYTKKELSCVETQVKLFWILLRYRMYLPLYMLVKIYSRFIAR